MSANLTIKTIGTLAVPIVRGVGHMMRLPRLLIYYIKPNID